MHSKICTQLTELVDRISRIVPDIEAARPGYSSGIESLCLLNNAIDKVKLLLQHCSECSKFYLVCTPFLLKKETNYMVFAFLYSASIISKTTQGREMLVKHSLAYSFEHTFYYLLKLIENHQILCVLLLI